MDIEGLKKLAGNIASRCDWVTEDWAFEHFGSEMEAKFVVAANPQTVLALIRELEEARKDVAQLRMRLTTQPNPYRGMGQQPK